MIPKLSHPKMLRLCVMLLLALCSASPLFAQAGRIYTKADYLDTGAIRGHIAQELTHAMAVNHDRVHVFLADLTEGGRGFRFDHLPVGKYDLVLITKSGVACEGLALGEPVTLSETSAKNLDKRISVADSFFNRYKVHRTGISPDGEMLLAFVERFRANDVLKGSGEALGQMIRRFEIIELARATDDWQMTSTRHVYREGEPIVPKPQFRKSIHLPALSNLLVVKNPKDLGEIALPAEFSN